jgi:hypothetical protein
VSVDKGKTWKDASELGTVDYSTTIDTGGRGDNPLTLRQDGSARVDFEAPDTLEPITLTFELRANDGALLSAGSRVDVVVLPPDPTRLQASGGGCTTSGWTPARRTSSFAIPLAVLGLLGLLARRRFRAPVPKGLTVERDTAPAGFVPSAGES